MRKYKNNNCKICNKLLTLNQKQNNEKFCSDKCRNDQAKLKKQDNGFYYAIKYIPNKTLINTIKEESGCTKCGEKNLPLHSYDFHHVGIKKHRVVDLMSRKTDMLLTELLQCTVLCSICHKELHYKSSFWVKFMEYI